MTIPIYIRPFDNQYTAYVIGFPEVQVSKPTRTLAVEAIRAEINERMAQGDLLFLDVDTPSITSLAGKYADDPMLQEICDEAYRLRDAERPE